MNFIDRIVDEKVSEARAKGLFDNLALHGKPIPDIDRRRDEGWWANDFVKRERQRVRQEETLDQLRREMRSVWAMDDETDVRAAVVEINETIAAHNRRARRYPIDLLDADDVVTRWRR